MSIHYPNQLAKDTSHNTTTTTKMPSEPKFYSNLTDPYNDLFTVPYPHIITSGEPMRNAEFSGGVFMASSEEGCRVWPVELPREAGGSLSVVGGSCEHLRGALDTLVGTIDASAGKRETGREI